MKIGGQVFEESHKTYHETIGRASGQRKQAKLANDRQVFPPTLLSDLTQGRQHNLWRLLLVGNIHNVDYILNGNKRDKNRILG